VPLDVIGITTLAFSGLLSSVSEEQDRCIAGLGGNARFNVCRE
jgi:hypothetical protein